MRIERIVVGQLDVNCYIVSDEKTSEAVIIDPGDEFERIAERVDAGSLKPKYILFTHAHYDHVCATGDLKAKYGASIVMHEDEKSSYDMTKQLCMTWGYGAEDFPRADMTVKDGDKISVGGISFQIIHTPGHTPGCICLYGENHLFTGDTLFQGSVGRTDLPGGNMDRLMASLKKLTALPPETKVLCGHGEETTLAYEMKNNPFLNSSFRLYL